MLPTDPDKRKCIPLATGLFDYFPDALAEVAMVSLDGNEQHFPGEPLIWVPNHSDDHPDALLRHFVQRGTFDERGISHTARAAWRALALLQTEINGRP